jgi:ABC-type oligopeptide transport system ATPase subunit
MSFQGDSVSGSPLPVRSRLSRKLIIADEPVSALECVPSKPRSSICWQKLSREMQLDADLASHMTCRWFRHISDRIAVMYLGADVLSLGPRSGGIRGRPDASLYTGLWSAQFRCLIRIRWIRAERILLTDDPPSPMNPPAGVVRFIPVVPMCRDKCRAAVPVLQEYRPGHSAACVRVREIGGI